MKSADSARARWLRLGQAEQLRIASVVARQRARALQKRYPNVTGVGVGLRTKRGRLQQSAPICLLFTVKTGQKLRWNGVKSLPTGVKATATRRGKRQQFDIPTDVLDLAPIS